ncbi:hypothetical protein H1R20_g6518, partial [Candolleomyces eurysporus]
MQPLQIQAIVGRHNLQQIHRTLQLAHRIGSIHLDSSLHHIHGLLDTLAHPNPALESLTVTVNTAGHGVQGQVYPPALIPTEIATVLDSLMLPPDVSLTCAVTCLEDWQQSMPRLAEALSVHSFAAASGGCPLQRLVISGLEEAAYPPAMAGVVYGGVHNGVAPLTVKGIPLLDLTIGPDSDPDFSSDEIIIRALTYVWKSLSLGSVHSLVLHDLDTVTQKAWTQFLKTLPSLRVLDITGHAPSGFVWALLLNAVACIQREERERERREKREKKALKIIQDAAAAAGRRPNSPESPPHSPLPPTSPLSPTPSSSRKLFVPRLTDIYLHGVDCTSGGYMVAPDAHVNSEWDLDDSRFLDVLLACLQMRSQAASAATANAMSGMPVPTAMSKLRSMSISNCRGVPRQTALLFREFVSHSVWDQRGMLKDGEDTGLARYRKVGVLGNGRDELRHYYRLKTLLDELDL